MTGLQWLVISGLTVGAGVAMIVWLVAPRPVALSDALARLAPAVASRRHHLDAVPARGGTDRLGRWVQRHLPAALLGRVPPARFALAQTSPAAFYAHKLLAAACGLLMPTVVVAVWWAAGLELPFIIPVGAGLVGLLVGWWLPNLSLVETAQQGRVEFVRSLTGYVDLVAMERLSGSGLRQAMENAALVGHSWPFQRIRSELALSRLTGVPPWTALRSLAAELDVRELADIADILRLAGEEGAVRVYGNLRARATALRSAMLTADKARANTVAERMQLPTVLLATCIIGILLTPPLLRIAAG